MNKQESPSDQQALNLLLFGMVAQGILSNSATNTSDCKKNAERIYEQYAALQEKFYNKKKKKTVEQQ